MDMKNWLNLERSLHQLAIIGSTVFQFCKKHWFNAFVLFFLIHLLLFKKINIQVSLESVAQVEAAEEPPITSVKQDSTYPLPKK